MHFFSQFFKIRVECTFKMSFAYEKESLLIRQAKLLQYTNNKRIDGDFNDVTTPAGPERVSANRIVLAYYSNFFESMFLSPLKKKKKYSEYETIRWKRC